MTSEPHETEAAFIAPENGRQALNAAAKLTRLGSYSIRSDRTLEITDRYFDTADRALSARLIVLRVREEDGRMSLGLKGTSERVAAGAETRIEIEKPWSAEALRSALAWLEAAGIPIMNPPSGDDLAFPTALEVGGFEVVQERETQRQVLLVVASDEDPQRLAEIDLDAVMYRLPHASPRLFEIEVEAEEESFEFGRLIESLLQEVPELLPWPYSKFATGIAIERALAERRIILEPDGVVPAAAMDTLVHLIAEIDLERLNRDTFAAEAKHPVGAKSWRKFLKEVLDETFILRRSRADGEDETKTSLLASIAEAQQPPDRSIVPGTVRVWASESLGVVASTVTLPVEGETKAFANIKIFVRSGGNAWRCVYWQVSPKPLP